MMINGPVVGANSHWRFGMAAQCLFMVLVLEAMAVAAFTVVAPAASTTRTASKRFMVPRWNADEQRWIPAGPEETASGGGYSKIKTLLMHGPNPFIQRVFQEDQYEQGVLKFMAGDQCSRLEAQGNMDAYLANPNDWAIARFESEKPGGYKPDYTTLKTTQLTLTLIWTVVLFTYLFRATSSFLGGGAFFPI
jgi:hypothetical protein